MTSPRVTESNTEIKETPHLTGLLDSQGSSSSEELQDHSNEEASPDGAASLSEAGTWPRNKKEWAQSFGRFTLNLLDCAAPAYLLTQVLPTPASICVFTALATAGFVINDRINEAAHSLVTKADPFSKLRAEGDGSVRKGFARRVARDGYPLVGVGLFGYSIGCVIMSYCDDMNKTDNAFLYGADTNKTENAFLKGLETALTEPVYAIPLLGLTGLGVNYLQMKFWDYVYPMRKEQELAGYDEVNVVQVFGKYVVLRYFEAFTKDTMIAWNLGLAGSEWDVMRLGAVFLGQETAKYLSTPAKTCSEENTEESFIVVKAEPTYCQQFCSLSKQLGKNLCLAGLGYGIDALVTCKQAPNLCASDDTLQNRAIRSAALAGALATGFVLEHIAPKLYQKTCSFFHRDKRDAVSDEERGEKKISQPLKLKRVSV